MVGAIGQRACRLQISRLLIDMCVDMNDLALRVSTRTTTVVGLAEDREASEETAIHIYGLFRQCVSMSGCNLAQVEAMVRVLESTATPDEDVTFSSGAAPPSVLNLYALLAIHTNKFVEGCDLAIITNNTETTESRQHEVNLNAAAAVIGRVVASAPATAPPPLQRCHTP